MKTLLGTFILLFAMQTASTGQCAVNARKLLEKNCKGTYLMHQEINLEPNATIRYSMIFKRNLNYAFYLLNPAGPITDVKLLVYKDVEEAPIELYSEINSAKNYSVYRFNTGDIGRRGKAFHVFVQSISEGTAKSCVIMAVYLED